MKTITSHIHRVSLTIFQYYVLPILLSSKLTLFQSYTPPILHSSNLTHYITHYTLTISQIGFTHTLHITHYTLHITHYHNVDSRDPIGSKNFIKVLTF